MTLCGGLIVLVTGPSGYPLFARRARAVLALTVPPRGVYVGLFNLRWWLLHRDMRRLRITEGIVRQLSTIERLTGTLDLRARPR